VHWARDVEPIAVEREADPARRVVGRRACHRNDDNGSLLTLELVHGSDRHRRRQARSQCPYLSVVRRDDEDVSFP
jgi:hypothetical protein